MRTTLLATAALLYPCGVWAAEISTFLTYVDTDICARLMLGPVTPSRTECSQTTGKDNAQPVLIKLTNNMVFTPNKDKLIRPLIGQLAEVSGEAKPKDGTIKLQDVKPVKPSDIPAGDPVRKIVEARGKAPPDPKLWEKIRHELAMMPYTTEFDFISFTLSGGDVILTGWTVRETNRDYANNVVKDLPGVVTVTNNIDVLPLGSFDMQIRAAVRAAFQRNLSRYFWGSGSDIKIVVKNGQVILLGTVMNKGDYDIAGIQANSVANVFKVFNLLRVQSSTPKKTGEKGD